MEQHATPPVDRKSTEVRRAVARRTRPHRAPHLAGSMSDGHGLNIIPRANRALLRPRLLATLTFPTVTFPSRVPASRSRGSLEALIYRARVGELFQHSRLLRAEFQPP